MATKTKQQLKDVFNGLSSVLFQSKEVNLGEGGKIGLSPEYDLPVTVDTLQISQDDPTVNHYKVIGLDGDWTSSATLGDMTIQFTVPTKATDVLKMAYGGDAVKDSVQASLDSQDYTGVALTIKKKKVTGTFILVNEEKDQIMIMSGVALWAKPLYENPGTEPFALQFTGTMETSGNPNFAWLKKSAAVAGGKP